MNEYQMLHETAVSAFMDIINGLLYNKTVKDFAKSTSDGLKQVSGFKKNFISNPAYGGSIAKRASNLILVFPVLVSNSLDIQTASIISKAIERKCVALLQILFSAINLTESEDLFGYIQQVHSNLGSSMDLDTFIGILDNIATHEGAGIEITDRDVYDAVMEDFKNINFHLDEALNEVSLNEYVSKYNMHTGESSIVLTEAKDGWHDGDPKSKVNTSVKDDIENARRSVNDNIDFNANYTNKHLGRIYNKIGDIEKKKAGDAQKQFNDDRIEYFRRQLLPQDIQKANELMPTMMAVNFTTFDKDAGGFKHEQTGIIGVKAKMYPIDGSEIVERLSAKYNDKMSLFKLIQASTREISFFRDFMFAIDKAKLDGIKVASNSGNARLFKLLERRAAKNRTAAMRKKNDASPITSLVMSQQEVDFMKKYKNIDLENRQVTKAILTNFNLLDIVIADETLEAARFMYDDDYNGFETLSFDALEREAKDNSYKKVLNLVNKSSSNTTTNK